MTLYSIRNPDTGRFESFSSWEAFASAQPASALPAAPPGSRADVSARTYAGMAGAIAGFFLGVLFIPPLLDAVGLAAAWPANVCAVLMLLGSIALAALTSAACARFAELVYMRLAVLLLLASVVTSATIVVAFGWWALT